VDVALEFSDEHITPWGGLGLMRQMLEHLEFSPMLQQAGLPAPRSGRGYAPEHLVMQFLLSIWSGGNRFAHAEVTRFDPVLGHLFGIPRMANFKAVMRLLDKFDQHSNDAVFGFIYRWLFSQLQLDHLTLDLDSTVLTRYGKPEGAAKGYNPTKPGRLSHHPLMAFVADTRMMANCWLRPGNSASANNASAFLASTLAHLADKQVGLVRADSGFCAQAFLADLEQRGLSYLVALKLTQPVQRALVSASGWWQLDDGIQLCSFDYQSAAWDKPRRVIGIRQHVALKPDAKGKQLSLFAEDHVHQQWRYAVLVTNLTLPAPELWRLYRGRADCENRIKELKYDFGADGFCMRNFWATEAALQFVMLAFNLMSLFRQAVLRSTVMRAGQPHPIQHTLGTLRQQLFAKAGRLTPPGRSRQVLKLAMAMQPREWFEGLWNRARTFELPIAFVPQFSSA
jgi:hypothetical protein